MTKRQLSFAVYLFYLAVALLITYPLVLNLSSQFIGHNTSDAYEMGHHLWWFKYALQNGQPLFYQTLMAYPDGLQGVSMWANPLQFFPAWLFTFVMPVAAAYNLTILLTMALNGWAMWWLARRLLDAEDQIFHAPSLLSGLVFMAFPTFQGHLFGGHAGLMVMWAVPFYIYALWQYIDHPTRRWFILSLIFYVLSPSGHTLQLFYVLMPVTALFFFTCLWRGNWVGAWRVVQVTLAGTAILFVFLLPLMQETLTTQAYAGEGGYVPFSLDLLAPVTPSFLHVFFGQLPYTHRVLGINIIEGSAYFGMVAAVLALIAVWTNSASRWWLLLALIAYVLGLGPLLKILDQPVVLNVGEYETYVTLPWAFLYDLPGFSLARTPGRFGFTLALAVAALAAYGMDTVWTHLPRHAGRWVVVGALMAFILWEYQSFFPFPTVPADVPEAVADLRERDDVRAVMDVPWGNLLAAKDGLYLQTWHQKPLVAGQVTRSTPVSPAKLTLLEETFDPALLDASGVDVIILHKQRADQNQIQRTFAALGAPYYEDERLALFNVPEITREAEMTVLYPNTDPVKNSTDLYLYAPEPGWMDLSGIAGLNGRELAVILNGQRVFRWRLDGGFVAPLPVDFRGFHTIQLVIEPSCPEYHNPTLECRAVRLDELTLTPLTEEPLYAPVQLAHGVRLAGAYLPPEPVSGQTLPVRLWWQFNQPMRGDHLRRFVHVTGADGVPVAQYDDFPGNYAAGEALSELLTVPLPDDLEGAYDVYTGWYTLPDLIRFPVTGEGRGAENGLVYLGTVTIHKQAD